MSGITERLTNAIADRYKIESHLGQGGMATVYLAHDLKHDRKVALKVLRPELAAVIGAERFLQEIKVTANLQHPHILPLHDSGEADSFLYYVMPYVEGDTLRDKLDREKQLGVDDAIAITQGIASALDYAHRQNVIHRDIKPENILLHDGQALVADFGIALAVSQAGGTRITETGLSLGTPHYMSPEQAMGDRELDARSDVYSLGAVLYEMLTGEPPYTGSTAQAIVARVITEDPRPLSLQRRTAPPHVADPADRFTSAASFAEALVTPGYVTPSHTRTGTAAAAPPRRRDWQKLVLAAALVVMTALASWAIWRPGPPATVARLDLDLGDIVKRSGLGDVVVSPDGSMLAVAGVVGSESGIYVRRIGEADFQLLPGTENGSTPAFSPDGQWIVFRNNAQRTIVKVAVSGGGVLTLLDRGTINPFLPHWGAEATIVLTGPQGTHVLSAGGGTPRRLDNALFGRGPIHLLPDGSGILGNARGGGVALYDMQADSMIQLLEDGRNATYVASGHLLYVPGTGGLFAVPFDLGSHRITGPAVRVLDRVASAGSQRGFSVSRGGTIVYLEGQASGGGGGRATRLLVMDRSGGADTLRLPSARRLWPRYSPDGRTIVYELVNAERNNNTDIYTFDLVTGTSTQITFDGDNEDPMWSPDGTRILFDVEQPDSDSTLGEDLFIKPADNSSSQQRILSRPRDQWPEAWLADDRIVFGTNEAGNRDLFTFALADTSTVQPYLQAPWQERDLALSPDGELAAFVSSETEIPEIWLRDFPTPEGKWRVSFGGGFHPRWSPDGGTLYFWHYGPGLDSLMAARIDRTPQVTVRQPELVLVHDVIFQGWDLHPDGERFLIVENEGAGTPTPATAAGQPVERYLVVLNWFKELRQRMAAQ